jgi:hypothetical protein
MPAVIDPYKHIMENLMPLNPDPHDGVPHHVKVETTDDGKIAIWVKDKFHHLEASEAFAFAQHLIQHAQAIFNRQQQAHMVDPAPEPVVETDPAATPETDPAATPATDPTTTA